MKSFGKVLGINLGLLLLYSIVIRVLSQSGSSRDGQLGILVMSCAVIVLHVAALLITGIAMYIAAKTQLANSIMLCAVITLVVGFGVCWGNASI